MFQTSVAVEEVVVLLLFSLMTASLQVFLWDCFQDGMIFRRYYLWLTLHWIRWRKRQDRWKRKILKPMGLCPYCQAPYLGVVALGFLSSCQQGDFLTTVMVIPLFLGFQHVVLKALLNKSYKADKKFHL